MSALNGKFIVLDGIDGCGKGIQTKLLSDFFIQKGLSVINKKYPDYGKPIGDLIHNYLYKKLDLNLSAELLLYIADHIKDKEYLQNCLKNDKIIIADRYLTSTLVYQSLKGTPQEKILNLINLMEAPRPDLCILIKISAETSLARKIKEKGEKLDRHEENLEFQKSLAKIYEKMAIEKIYCDWEIIDGETSPQIVNEQIIKILYKKFNL